MQTYNTTGLSTVDQKFLEINGESTVTNWSCICVNLQLGEAAIHQAHSLESTTQFKCLHKSFVLFVGFFPLAMIAFELLQQPVQGMALHSALSFFVSCTGRQNRPFSCVLSC